MTKNIVIESGERIVLPDWVDDTEWVYERTKNSFGVYINHLTHVPSGKHAYGNWTESPFFSAVNLRNFIEQSLTG